MSLLFRKNESDRPLPKRGDPGEDSTVWKPDWSLPYVIHIPEQKQRGLPFVCIWPQVKPCPGSDPAARWLSYYLNREHLCQGVIVEKSPAYLLFRDEDGHFGNQTVELAVITDEEFEAVRACYEKNRWPQLRTKEDLTQNFIDCLDD